MSSAAVVVVHASLHAVNMFLSQRGGVERPASGLLASHVATANEARSERPLIGSFPRLQRLVLRCAREGDRLDRGFCEGDFHPFFFQELFCVTPGRQARAVSLRGPCVYVQMPPPPPPPPADPAPHARSARQERRRRCLARRRALSSAVSRRK